MVSVTQVLKPFTDFSGVPQAVLEHAAARGTQVHAACAAHARGLFVMDLDQEVQPYLQSFTQWFDYAVSEVVAVEKELTHPLGFVGHPDLIVNIKGDKYPSVVDIKTPQTTSKLWQAQLSAYLNCAQQHGIPADRAFSLRLKPDGGFPIINEYISQPEDYAAFLNAFYAHKYFREAK